MDDETDATPQTAGSDTTEVEGKKPADSADQVRERVRAQRRHITGLTGKDPLRGGIDD
ncbi:hypothetical protein [Phenylobacterium sp.]|jgi:hypothetical protein|uniref:hypothetical protein n=1 Tax=Phenylobacterium sp. TaxID=1871053 RepID=UPI0025DAA0BD|nr:hypothetical protein [Phenylobacterium sp.]|tara:strand:- start:27621 stop:27794 length:174 start_codon:yes stop_codon:yes gene_type:complete